jgi:hypothetical protein
MCEFAQSCGWTLAQCHGFVRRMDDDTAKLIADLYTRVGIIMEDVSIVALTLGSAAAIDRSESLKQIERAADQISKLMQAARALDG